MNKLQKYFFLLIFFVLSFSAKSAFASTIIAASGVAGNWTSGSAWVGGVAPTSADDVEITGSTISITINAGAVARSVDFTGFTGIVTHNAGAVLTIGDATAGLGNIALKFVSAMTYTLGSDTSSAINFISTSNVVQSVDYAGKKVGNQTFNSATNGSWKIIGSDASNTTGILNLTQGALDTNSVDLSFGSFSSNVTNPRTLILGTSTIKISANAFWNMNGVNMNFSGASSTIINTGTIPAFTGGSLTYGTVQISPVIEADFNDSNIFDNLIITGPGNKTTSILLFADQTVTGNFTIAGNSAINRLLIQSNILGVARTINNAGANMMWSFVDFRDVSLGIPYDASGIIGGSGDCGGNKNIIFSSPQDNYWVSDTGFWSDSAKWKLSDHTTSGRIPLPQDGAIFDASSFTIGSQAVTLDMSRAGKSISWTGVTNNPVWIKTTPSIIYGSVSLSPAMTNSGTIGITLEGRSSFNWTSAGVTWTNPITQNMIGGTIMMQDDFNSSSSWALSNGTLNANNFNFTAKIFNSNNSNTRSLVMGSGTWTITGVGVVWDTSSTTGFTLLSNTSTIKIIDTSNTAVTFAGGDGLVYHNLWFSRGASIGSNIISASNTFADFKDDGNVAHSILFTTGTTQTVSTFTVSGTSGNLITINSTNTGTYALLKAGGGTISSDFLNIQHSIATLGNIWYAGLNSVDNQAVATPGSGWIFTAPSFDTTPPTITNISSNKINGTYGVGEVIDINVTFSEAVTSTGNVTITLDTGRSCTFTVLASLLGTCNYIVQAGDSSPNLNVSSIAGIINDMALNPMTNFSPAINLSASKMIVINTTTIPPPPPQISSGGSGPLLTPNVPVNNIPLSPPIPLVANNSVLFPNVGQPTPNQSQVVNLIPKKTSKPNIVSVTTPNTQLPEKPALFDVVSEPVQSSQKNPIFSLTILILLEILFILLGIFSARKYQRYRIEKSKIKKTQKTNDQ